MTNVQVSNTIKQIYVIDRQQITQTGLIWGKRDNFGIDGSKQSLQNA